MIKKIIFVINLIIGFSFYGQKSSLLLDTTSLKYERSIKTDTTNFSINYCINGSGNFLVDSTIIYEDFFSNGQRKSLYSLINNSILNGPYITWHKNGKMESIINYVYGLPYGGSTSWHENGKVKSIGDFWLNINVLNTKVSDSIKVNSKKQKFNFLRRKVSFEGLVSTTLGPLKNGEWKYYNENGKIIKKEIWRKGERIKVTD